MTDAQRTALITGASAGLGYEFACQLAPSCTTLILVARRQDKLETLAQLLHDQHPDLRIEIIVSDLAQPNAPAEIHAQTQTLSITVDVLINNAGAGGPDLLDERDWQIHAQYLQLMMTSVTQLCHLFIPAMLAQGWGRVINVSSVAGRMVTAGDGHYGPAKSYLIALSEALSLRLTKTGVHVCALCPGFTHTDFHNSGELSRMKNDSPGFLWYDAKTVVAEGLAAVEEGRDVYMSGRLYRWIDGLFQFTWSRAVIKWFLRRQFHSRSKLN